MIETKERRGIAQCDAGMAEVEAAALKLLAYCQSNDWAGDDPYDALNSRLFRSLPFLDFRLARLALTQGMKRSPINLRRWMVVPRTHNPKAMALFVPALLKLSRIGLLPQEQLIGMVTEKLVALRSENSPYWCWGYNFPWQSRVALVPRGLPNIICTTFAANALLDVYEVFREPRWISIAVSAAEFVRNVLYRSKGDEFACFDYTPLGRSEVHNANLLGAAFLCRVSKVTGDKTWLGLALKAVRFSVSKQYKDGSWDYGEAPSQRWKDNFHTGFNLCALRSIGRYAETSEFESSVQHGFEFYKNHFFRKDGAPKYYHDRTYPIDIHSVAQSIITLLALKDLDDGNIATADAVLRWAMAKLWNRAGGFFYYQKLPCYTVRIPYMRWGQAWMLLALATLLEEPDQSAIDIRAQ